MQKIDYFIISTFPCLMFSRCVHLPLAHSNGCIETVFSSFCFKIDCVYMVVVVFFLWTSECLSMILTKFQIFIKHFKSISFIDAFFVFSKRSIFFLKAILCMCSCLLFVYLFKITVFLSNFPEKKYQQSEASGVWALWKQNLVQLNIRSFEYYKRKTKLSSSTKTITINSEIIRNNLRRTK